VRGRWTLWGPTWQEGAIIAPRVEGRVFAMTGAPLSGHPEKGAKGEWILRSEKGFVVAFREDRE
jgi:hypothetical protein